MRLSNSKKEIRLLCLILLVGNIFLEYASWATPLWLYPANYAELNDYVLSKTSGGDNWMMLVIALLVISIMSYISIIGIIFFKNWARRLFVLVFMMELVALPFTGLGLSSGADDLLSWLIGVPQVILLVYLFQDKSIAHFKPSSD